MNMLRLSLDKGVSARQAVDGLNLPSAVRTLQRRLAEIHADESLKRSTAEATLEAQLQPASLDPQQSENLRARRNPTFADYKYFVEDEIPAWDDLGGGILHVCPAWLAP